MSGVKLSALRAATMAPGTIALPLSVIPPFDGRVSLECWRNGLSFQIGSRGSLGQGRPPVISARVLRLGALRSGPARPPPLPVDGTS